VAQRDFVVVVAAAFVEAAVGASILLVAVAVAVAVAVVVLVAVEEGTSVVGGEIRLERPPVLPEPVVGKG